MPDIIETIEQDIIKAIEEDRVQLPTLPEVALKIRETVNDSNSSIADLTNVISNDAAISARIIKVCNSPLLRPPNPVSSLQMAINRLGMQYTADLATGLAMSQMFQATTDVIDTRMRDLWSHNTMVAGLCHALAENNTRLSPAKAMLAGLTHKIGTLPILYYAEDHDHLSEDPQTLDLIISKLHQTLGTKILETWDFEPDICKVPNEYLDFKRDTEKSDFVDVVMVANLQSLMAQDHPYNEMDWSQIPAFTKLGINPYPEESEEDEEDLTANMEAAFALLR